MKATEPQWEDLAIRAPLAPARPAPRAKPQVQSAHLAHELRAPVTSIRWGLEALIERVSGRLDADERRMLELAIRNAVRLEGLVDDILDYTKLAAGKMAIIKEACEARALVDDAAGALQAAATAKGVRIVKSVGPLLPRVSAESRRVVGVLINLLSNAIKFTPARGVVTISVAEGRFEHRGTLLFTVKDTGAGIPPKMIDKIFGLFEQAGTSGAKDASGTGLGLTLARAMVELHGGRIWAKSWEGAGASFCFTIPVAPADLARPVSIYPEPLRVHGLVAVLARRVNAFLALVV